MIYTLHSIIKIYSGRLIAGDRLQEVLPMANKIIEGLWDCPYCDQKGIGGLTKQCPNCGHPQDEGTVFYLPSKKEYLDKETAAMYGKGADWICSFCESLNRYDNEVCSNCGASREDSIGDYFSNKTDDVKEAVAEKDVYGTPSSKPASLPEESDDLLPDQDPDMDTGDHVSADSSSEDKEEPVYKKYQKEARAKKHRESKREAERKREEAQRIRAQKMQSRAKLFAGLGLALIVILVFMFWPRTASGTLESKSWTRDITVEESRTVKEADWSVPEGGRTYESKKELHHYNEVLDHYEPVEVARTRQVPDGFDTSIEYVSNGDGTFTEREVRTPRYRTETYYETVTQPIYRKEAVYQTKYYYEIERWFESRHVTTKGGAENPYWGEPALGEKEKEGKRTETYTLAFKEKRHSYSIEVPLDYWLSLKPGTTVKLTISNGKIIKIDGKEIN